LFYSGWPSGGDADIRQSCQPGPEQSNSLRGCRQPERVTASAHQILTAIANMPVVQQRGCRLPAVFTGSQALGYVNLGIVGIDGYLRCIARAIEGAGEVWDRRAFSRKPLPHVGAVASVFKGCASVEPVVVLPSLFLINRHQHVAFAAVSAGRTFKPFDAPLKEHTL
jgi:hypothetical protein